MRNSIKSNFLSLISILLLIILGSCYSETTSEEQDIAEVADTDNLSISKKQFKASAMELATIKTLKFADKIAVNGRLDVPPEFRAAVSAYYGGYVKNISILPGYLIKKGGVLFTLENPEFIIMQQAFLESDGRLGYLKNDYERQKSLLADKISAEKDFLQAEASYKSEKAKRASLKKQLALINIDAEKLTAENMRSVIAVTSPIKGYIHKVKAEKGMYLAPKDVAVTVTNTEHIHIELNVYEKDYDKLKIGQEINFTLQNQPDTIYSGSVYLISRSIEADTRVIDVHGHLKDEQSGVNFIPGMYVEAEILTNSGEKMALPEEAIVNRENKNYVLAMVEKSDSSYQFSAVEVIVEETQNGFTAIKNSDELSSYSQFLSKGAFNLINE